MATDLKDYLRDNPPGDFREGLQYFESGDFLTYFLEDAPHHAKRIDAVVTVYLANDTDRFVGCKIKGVRHILKTAGDFRVQVRDADITLGFFFFLSYGPDRCDADRKYLAALKQIADVTVPHEMVCPGLG